MIFQHVDFLFLSSFFLHGPNRTLLQFFESKKSLKYESEWYKNLVWYEPSIISLILPFTHSLTHSPTYLFKHLLSAFQLPGVVQGAGLNIMIKTKSLKELTV